MNRREFTLMLPASWAGSKLSWMVPAAERPATSEALYLSLRSGSSEGRCNSDYQDRLRDVVEQLQDVGYSFDALQWGTDYAPVSRCLTGTYRFDIQFFPAAFAPILAEWMSGNSSRYVTVSLGNFNTTACKSEEMLQIANPWNAARPYSV